MTSTHDLEGKSFEELAELLETTLQRMEDEPLTLNEAIDAYELAVEIARACNDLLDRAELRIRTVDARLMLVEQQADLGDDEDLPF
jgi:exodeoxyribonuclease VII small subunit